MDNVISSADVIKRAVRLGAEVRNMRLSGDLSDDALRAIRRLLLEHKVIFFCDQQHLDDAEQQRFAVRLGRMIPSPQAGVTDRTSSFLEPSSGRSSGANQERADVVFDDFRNISVLRAVTTTPHRGDTVWSNTVAAYLDLPLSLRMLADELWAVHTNSNPYAVNEQSGEANEMQFDEGGTGRSPKPSFRWFGFIPKRASARSCLAISCSALLAYRNIPVKSCSTCSNPTSRRHTIPCAGGGGKATLRSGINASRSRPMIIRWWATAICSAAPAPTPRGKSRRQTRLEQLKPESQSSPKRLPAGHVAATSRRARR